MTDDFLIRVRVDQRGVELLVREMNNLPARLKRIEQDILRSAIGAGARPTASADPVTKAVRRQVEIAKKGQAAVRRNMSQVADMTQKDVLRRMKASYVRPDASTGALEAFTANTRNRRSTDSFFGVGDVDRMLRSRTLRYALAIEGGSSAAVRRRQVLTGYWQSGAGVYGASKSRRGDIFVQTSTEVARRVLAEAGRSRDSTFGIVRNPIKAHQVYRKTAQYFQPQKKTAEAIRKAFGGFR